MRTLYCPFESQTSEHEAALEAHGASWVAAHDLLSARTTEKLAVARFAALVARAFPTAPLERLLLAADWNTWLFLQDDRCDEASLGRRPRDLRAENQSFLRVMLRSAPAATPLETALADIRDRLEETAPLDVSARFHEAVQAYFEACEWEAENRATGRAPDAATYRRMRAHTGAVSTCFSLIEATEGFALPLEARCHPALTTLSRLANAAICWSNDLFSVKKEARAGDFHNLVLILIRERGVDFAEACAAVADEHDSIVRRFVALDRRLSRSGGPNAAVIERYVRVLRTWMRANLDWSALSGRYRTDAVPSGTAEAVA